jgi:hypothetical protein
MHPNQSFRWRSFVSIAIVFAFLVMSISGIALFLRPEGSLARWAGWSLLGADKKQWESVHTATVVLFVVLAVLHLWYNWRTLLAYLRRTATSVPARVRFELVAAVVLVGVIVTASLVGWQPFAALMDLRGSLKDGQFAVRTSPPVADADKLTVSEVCARAGVQPENAAANARARGVAIDDTSKTIGAVAKQLGLTPESVFEVLIGAPSK